MENTRIYEALLASCKAERLEALATLDVYMSNPVGIGEHPQIVEEAMKQLDKLAAAEGKIVELEKQYGGVKREDGSKVDLEELSLRMDNFLKTVTGEK
tara:strand:- start:49 stop:342 length:294 start_codon:yes stop_codon:yes gene_type:complete